MQKMPLTLVLAMTHYGISEDHYLEIDNGYLEFKIIESPLPIALIVIVD